MADQVGRADQTLPSIQVRDADELIANVRLIEMPDAPMVTPAERAELDAIRELRRAVTETTTVRTICRTYS
jgi:hypothetical protein